MAGAALPRRTSATAWHCAAGDPVPPPQLRTCCLSLQDAPVQHSSLTVADGICMILPCSGSFGVSAVGSGRAGGWRWDGEKGEEERVQGTAFHNLLLGNA